jgi:hypothetical protein
VQGLLEVCFLTKQLIVKYIYIQVILGQFFLELTEKERLYGLFQQDLATVRTARMSMQALSDVFRDRRISSGQHVHSILILVIFLLGLLEGQNL